jgi:hypothetical protein
MPSVRLARGLAPAPLQAARVAAQPWVGQREPARCPAAQMLVPLPVAQPVRPQMGEPGRMRIREPGGLVLHRVRMPQARIQVRQAPT